jgi:hypothetical protein
MITIFGDFGQCNDPDFRRFGANKKEFFLKTNDMINSCTNYKAVLKTPKLFGDNYIKNLNIGPRTDTQVHEQVFYKARIWISRGICK